MGSRSMGVDAGLAEQGSRLFGRIGRGPGMIPLVTGAPPPALMASRGVEVTLPTRRRSTGSDVVSPGTGARPRGHPLIATSFSLLDNRQPGACGAGCNQDCRCPEM